MEQRLIIVIGAYGSGKSEFAANLAEQLNEKGGDIALVDLDVVNPYFRSRDLRESFSQKGIDVICPAGEYKYADLPMVSPRISGTILKPEKTLIMDVGGDPAGCRALARYTNAIKEVGYDLKFVVNTMRPFTNDIAGIINMLDMLEETTKLKVTEIVANSNLLSETTEEIVLDGIDKLSEVAKLRGITFKNYLVISDLSFRIADNLGGKKKMVLNYHLQKPWERVGGSGI